MGRKRPYYTPEFKTEAIRLSRESEKPVSEVASIGPRIVQAIGLSQSSVGDRVGDHPLEKENASRLAGSNEAFSKVQSRAGDEI